MSMSNDEREFVVRNANDPSVPYRLECGDGLTKQSFKDECDINNILKKYEKTGILEHRAKYEGQYADVTGTVDYQTALNTVRDAEAAFMSLPASIRTEFENDPHEFLEFAQNPENEEALIEMGLATPKRSDASEKPEVPDKEAPEAPEPSEPGEPGLSEAKAKPA